MAKVALIVGDGKPELSGAARRDGARGLPEAAWDPDRGEIDGGRRDPWIRSSAVAAREGTTTARRELRARRSGRQARYTCGETFFLLRWNVSASAVSPPRDKAQKLMR